MQTYDATTQAIYKFLAHDGDDEDALPGEVERFTRMMAYLVAEGFMGRDEVEGIAEAIAEAIAPRV